MESNKVFFSWLKWIDPFRVEVDFFLGGECNLWQSKFEVV